MEEPPHKEAEPARASSSDSPRPPTMEDVAARAGVSRALVSIVFRDLPGASPQNRERVRRAAEEIGFQPDRRASLLGRHRTNLLGISFGVGHEFHADLISALYTAAERHQLEVVLSGVTKRRSEHQAVADLLAFRCDALMLLGSGLGPADLARIAETTPVITLARAVQAPGVDVVRTDDELGARLATEHLLGLGHRTIAHLDGRRAAGGAERRRGFLHAMRAAGLPDQAFLHPGGLDEADGVAAARHFLADRAADQGGDPIPTAVFAFNDLCAVGFLQTVRDAGVRVPEDLSLVGYDDSRIAHASWTRLTTVAQDASVLADRSVAIALARMAHREPGSERVGEVVLVPPSLVIRGTTGPPGDPASIQGSLRL